MTEELPFAGTCLGRLKGKFSQRGWRTGPCNLFKPLPLFEAGWGPQQDDRVLGVALALVSASDAHFALRFLLVALLDSLAGS